MNLKIVFAGLGLLCLAPSAHAQIVIQAPRIPGITTPVENDRNDYWRREREGEREAQWRRREEYRDEEHRKEEWQRAHCVRDWQNQEFCRR